MEVKVKAPALVLILAFALFFGCATVQTRAVSIPESQMAEKAGCRITMTPVKASYTFYVAFSFEFKNEGGSPISVDWNRSRYFMRGQNMGKLVYRGQDPKKVTDNEVPLDEIPPGGSLTRLVAPQSLLAWAPGRDRRGTMPDPALSAGKLPMGSNKVVLVMVKDGKSITQSFEVDLEQVEIPKEENQ